ncbi:TOTE conflict system archaeo-eukaryotic primase domain-containing protein [Solidesulfovibrio magneticus]|nr:DUF927 domain-containing protein [Solidesulfovibrio magneticus]
MDISILHQAVYNNFRGREDVIAKKSAKKKPDGKLAWYPYCQNSFKEGACPRIGGKRQSCITCEAQQFHGYTPEIVQQHIKGDLIIGIYPLLKDSRCWFIAADFDNHAGTSDPYKDVMSYAGQLLGAGLTPYVLRSTSGTGYHVYVFFSSPVPAWKARVVVGWVLQASGALGGKNSGESFDCFFPKQDTLDDKGLGNLIALPFQGEASEKGHTLLLDPATDYQDVFADQVAALNSIVRSDEANLDALIAAHQLERPVDNTGKAQAKLMRMEPTTTLPGFIPERARNNTLFCFACSLQAKGYADDDIRGVVHERNITECQPPLPLEEVDSIIAGVLTRYPKGSKKGANGNGSEVPIQCSKRVLDVLLDAPVQGDAVVPPRYALGVDGVFEIREKQYDLLMPVPLVVSLRMKDIVTKNEIVEVAWLRDGCWEHHQVPKRTIADSKDLLGLADKGLLVTSSNARDVIDYLYAYEVANLKAIQVQSCSGQLGWQAQDSFLWGAKQLVPNDVVGATDVTFVARDDGDRQFAEGLVSKGNLENWVAMVNKVSQFDPVFIVVMASLAAPFLQVLDAANFVLDLAGETSKGKTTSERLAAAAWGDPIDGSSTSIILNWAATPVFMERRASLLNGIPLILDDTKTASSPETVAAFVYSFGAGRAKGRGSIKGTQQSPTYSTILITSGEQSITDIASSHGGVAARALSLWGAPFGDGDNSALVNELEQVVAENHGHAGPRVVQFILDHRDEWPLWKEAYRESIQFWTTTTEGNSPSKRLSKSIAFLSVVIPLVHAAIPELQIAKPMREVLKGLLVAVNQGAQQADRAKEALKTVWEWAVSNPTKFWEQHRGDSNERHLEPHQGWAGRWETGKAPYIGFTGKALGNILGVSEVATMTKTWSDRGWLKQSSSKGLQVNTRVNGSLVGLYVVPLATFESILGLGDQE